MTDKLLMNDKMNQINANQTFAQACTAYRNFHPYKRTQRPGFRSKPNISFSDAIGPPNVLPDPVPVPGNFVDFVYKNKVIDFCTTAIQNGTISVDYSSTRVSGILYWTATMKITDTAYQLTFSETTKDLARYGVYRQYYESQQYLPYMKAKSADRTLQGDFVDAFGKVQIADFIGNSGDADQDGQNVLDTENAQNTMLTMAEGEDVTIIADLPPTHRPAAYIDGGLKEYATLADRYLSYGTVNWNTTHARGDILAQYDMPRAVLTDNVTSPNAQLFYMHTYSRPEMTHKFQLNSSNFHCGTIIIAVRYNNVPGDTTFITSALQLFALPHVLIQASSSSSSHIEAPFIYPLSLLPTRATNMSPANYYHTVYIGVINPLSIGDGGSTAVTIKAFAKFSTSDRQTAFAMERTRYVPNGAAASVIGAVGPIAKTVGSVAGVVEKTASGIGSIFSSNNQDRPVLKLDHPQFTVFSTPDMSLGDGPIDIVTTRLQKDRLVPFDPAIVPVNNNEFNYGYLTKIKGYLGSFTWSEANNHMTQLYEWDITPYNFTQVGEQYLYPTLSELSLNYLYYSGNMKVELLCGNSQLQSGRLLICFVPDGTAVPTVDNVYDFAYIIFDLQSQQAVDIEIPNCCPQHITPIRYSNKFGAPTSVISFGRMYIFVETPLRHPSSCSSSCDITLLLHAHDNFKFHVLASNALVPNSGGDERIDDKTPLFGYAINDVPDTTIGENFETFNSCRRFNRISTFELTPTTTTQIQRVFIPVTPNFIVDYNDRNTVSHYDIVSHFASGFRYYKGGFNYVIHCSTPGTSFDAIFVPHAEVDVETTSVLSVTANQLTLNNSNPFLFSNYSRNLVSHSVNSAITLHVPYYSMFNMLTNQYSPTDSETRFASQRCSLGNLIIEARVTDTTLPTQFDVYRSISDDAEYFLFQGFPLRTLALDSITPANDPPSFNVQFTMEDIILPEGVTLTLYGLNTFYPNGTSIDDLSQFIVDTSTAPAGTITLNSNLWYYLVQSDVATLYQIVATPGFIFTLTPNSTVQVTNVDIEAGTSVSEAWADEYDALVRLQDPHRYEIVGIPDTAKLVGNESLPELIPDSHNLKTPYQVMCAIKDLGGHVTKRNLKRVKRTSDRSLRSAINMEQNFRRLLFFAEPSQLEGNIDFSSFNYLSYLNPFTLISAWRNYQLANQASAFMSQASDSLSNFTNFLSNTTTNVTNTAASAYTVFSGLVSNITNIFSEWCPEFVKNGISKFTDCAVHIFNLIFSKELTTRIASFIGIFSSVGLFVYDKLASVYNLLSSMFSTIKQTIWPQPDLSGNADDDVFAEGAERTRNETIMSYFKFIFPLLVSMLGISGRYEKQGWTALKSFVMDSVKFSNDVTRFFQFNVDIIGRFINWFLGTSQPDLANILVIEERKDEMKKWIDACCVVTQGHMRDLVFSSSGYQRHLDLLYRQGCEYLQLFNTRRLNISAFMLIFRKISDLHQAVGQRVGRGRLTKEPVRLWFYGAPGVGKSNLASYVTTEMLKNMGIVYDGACIYTRNFTQYWNGWADQPAVLYDDWGQTNAPESNQRTIEEFFSLASIAEFNAPMPAIEDKDRMVNPEMVVICSNQSYPRMNTVTTHQALWRRRDFLIECTMKSTYAGKTADDPTIPLDIIQSYKHLEFKILDPVNENKTLNSGYDIDTLLSELKTKIAVIRTRRVQAATSRTNHLFELSHRAWADRLTTMEADDPIRRVVETSLANQRQTILSQLLQPGEPSTSSAENPPQVSVEQPPQNEEPASSVVSASDYEDIVGNCPTCERYPDLTGVSFRHRDCVQIEVPEDFVWPEGFSCLCDIAMRRGSFCTQNYLWIAYNSPQLTYYCEWIPESHNEYILIPLGAAHCSSNCHYTPLTRLEEATRLYQEQYNTLVGCEFTYLRERMRYGLYGPIHPNADTALRQLTDPNHYTAEHFDTERLTTPNFDASNAPIDFTVPHYPTYESPEPSWTISEADVTEFAASRPSWLKALWQIVSKLALVLLSFIIFQYLLKTIFSILDSLFPCMARGLTSVISKLAITIVSNLVFRKSLESLLGNIAASGDVRTPRMYSTPVRVLGNAPDPDPEPISDNKTEQFDNFNRKFNNNTILLRLICKKKGIQYSLRALMLGGRVGIMPMHYTTFIKAKLNDITDVEIKTRSSGGATTTYPVTLDSITYRRILDLDLCRFDLPARIPVFPKITQLFATAHICSNTFSGNARLYTPWDATEGWRDTDREFNNVKFAKQQTGYSDLEITLLGYTYPYADKGACMSLLCDKKSGFIIGVHTTGTSDNSQGVSTVVCRELLAQVLEGEDLLEPGTIYETTEPADKAVLKLVGNVEVLGSLGKTRELRTNVKTSIAKSPMYGLLANPPSRYPAQMTAPGEPKMGYGPLKEACEMQLTAPGIFPRQVIDIAAKDLAAELITKAPPTFLHPKQCRSLDQAVLGMPGVAFYEPLKLSTSPGYPLCVDVVGSHKKDFVTIDDERQTVKLDSRLTSLYQRDHLQRVDGIVPFVPYADFGKDERLKPGKGMRLINGAPFQEILEWRRYSADFFCAFQKAQLEVGSAIGLNVFGSGMDQIAKKLLAKGNAILTGDYKAFGPRVMAEVTQRVCGVVNQWYDKYCGVDPIANRVRCALFEEMISCYHVAGDLLYRTMCGNPSGNPYTAPLNTLVAIMYLRCVWQLVFKGKVASSMSYFHRYFAYVCYGDDFIGSIDKSFLDLWNTETMSSVFAEYGIVFTDVGKTGTIVKYTSLQEASFLKCTFGRHPTRDLWIAQLEKTVIEDIISWYRKPCPDMDEYLVQVADQTIRFSFFWGRAYYNGICAQLVEAFRVRGQHWSHPTWEQMDCIYNDDSFELWIDLW